MTKENVKEICNKLGVSDEEVIGVKELCETLGVSYEEVMATAEKFANLYCENNSYDEVADWNVNTTMNVQPKHPSFNTNDCEFAPHSTNIQECCNKSCSCKESESIPYPSQEKFDEIYKNITKYIGGFPPKNNIDDNFYVVLVDEGSYYNIWVEVLAPKENIKIWVDEFAGTIIVEENEVVSSDVAISTMNSTHKIIIPENALIDTISAEMDEHDYLLIRIDKQRQHIITDPNGRYEIEIG